MDKEKEYVEIWVEGLSVMLAEDKFNEDTVNIPMADKYEDVLVEKEGEMVLTKQLHGKWVTLYYNLRDQFHSLVMQFAREKPE